MVERTTITSREVTVAASELPAYIASLPRLLTENLYIKVSGTLTEPLMINGFYGSGYIEIAGKDCVFLGTAEVDDCAVMVLIHNVKFQNNNNPSGTSRSTLLSARRCQYLRIADCEFSNVDSAEKIGAVASDSGSCLFVINCKIHGVEVAAHASRSSILSIGFSTISEEEQFYDNVNGAYVWSGGIIRLYNVPDLLGGNTNAKQGGIIVKSDGTLL